MNRGEAAVAILKAIMRGDDYPPAGVEDTPENRKLWDDIRRDMGHAARHGRGHPVRLGGGVAAGYSPRAR